MPSNEPQNCCAAQKQCCKSVDSNNTTTTTTIAKSCSNGTKCCRNETPAYKPVTHVIFDLDGLLIDSEVRFANAIAILLKRYGVPEYSKELQEKVLGMEVARGIEEIIRVTGIPLTVAEFMVKEREIYMEEMLNVQLMPGVTRLVQHLRKHRIPMAIATGSTKESYEIKVRNHQQVFEAGRYFDHIVFTRDDPEVKRPKPAPDVYLITANRWKNIVPSPDKCLVFEDSSIGVDGAIAAGMQCVMIPDTRFPRKQPNATLILTTLEHFKPELFGLPPFDE